MSRLNAIERATRHLDSGAFKAELARAVAVPSASREPSHSADLERYVVEILRPAFLEMGFSVRLGRNELAPGPFLLAERIESPDVLTILQYGHGDVVTGLEPQWSHGLSPWHLVEKGDHWYGRGTADNKGQHLVNIAAMRAVLETRGRLGFNCKFLIEMGEESGSVGLQEYCEEHRGDLTADLFVASDGPRLSLTRPTMFLGARGGMSFHLTVESREGFHHSGNWGGLLSNPGVELAHAIATLIGPRGQILVPGLVPDRLPDSVRRVLSDCVIEPAPGDPAIQEWWGGARLVTCRKSVRMEFP